MDTEEIKKLEAFLADLSVSQHHIEHYNHLILYELPELIQNFVFHTTTKDDHKVTITFKNVHIEKASYLDNGRRVILYPDDCRTKDLYYSGPVFATVIQKKTTPVGDKVTVLNKVLVCEVPVMVGSVLCNLRMAPKEQRLKECSNDPQGYFILNGKERVLVTQEIGAYNMTQVTQKKDTLYATMRSMSEDTGHSVLVQCMISTKSLMGSARISLPYLSKPISLAVFFKAFGLADPEEIYKNIGIDEPDLKSELVVAFEALKQVSQTECLHTMGQYATKITAPASVEDDPEDISCIAIDEEEEEILSDKECADFESEISECESLETTEEEKLDIKNRQKKIDYVQQIFETEIFPHLGVLASKQMILDVVYYMLKHLFLTRARKLVQTERDNLMFKRFENSGALLFGLFKICFKHYFGNLKKSNIGDIISGLSTFVSKTVKSNLAKGEWGIKKNAYTRMGVSQVLNRLSYIGTLSHLQRVAIPMGKEGKNIKIRQIHPSQFGYICLYETPEGKPCGIVNNMTISARFTRAFSIGYTRDILKRHCNVDETSAGDTQLWINYTSKFMISNPRVIMAKVREMRVTGMLSKYINIYYDEILDIVHLLSTAGRITRPFYDRQGNIVWLDPAECQHSQIAMYPDESGEFEYCEIHPCLLYGAAAGCIPFSDHNQSPRNVYEASMIKQALGIFCHNLINRYDSTYEVMYGVQRTLVSTAIARSLQCQELPAGINCVVAVCCLNSWNTEDSLIFKKEAIERGMFPSFTFKTITVEEYKEKSSIVKTFCLPDLKIRRNYNYDLLDDNGFVRVGSLVQKKDVIVGRVHHAHEGDCDFSELAQETGYVERVNVFKHVNGYRMCKITLKITKIPERGDKFANMCAQKGTIGMILPQEDMPFTIDGIIPDVMINPNALPSRMTISMVIEMVLGKYGCLAGELIDATPFSENSTSIVDRIGGLLSQYGFTDNGKETMYSGETGRPMRTRIFTGISYYQKLKHMVEDKLHARPFGVVTTMTRQPQAGRKHDGGLRIGEMERDNIIGMGAESFLTHRLFNLSDPFMVDVCRNCNILSNHKDECHLCRSTNILRVRLSFASKLFFEQLTACMISWKITTELL